MPKPTASIITSYRPIRRHVTRALASAGFDVNVSAFEHQAIEEQLDANRDLYVIDGDEDKTEAGWLFHQLSTRGLNNRAMVLAHEADPRKVLDIIADAGLQNLVSRHEEANKDLIDESELIVNCRKMVSGDFFGLEKYLSTWGVALQSCKVSTLREKISALADLESFLEEIQCNRRISPGIVMATEELVNNALVHAPCDADGRPKYSNVERSEIALQAGEEATLTFGCDGEYIGISVSDPFGSLGRDVIVRYLRHLFRGTKEEDASRSRGAKLGLHVVFNSVTQLVFNLAPGKRTEIIGLFYIRGGARAFKGKGRSLNIFAGS